MLLFLRVLFTMFIAEMGDKTQLLMIAMTSKFKLRDIILGSGLAILVLNGLAVALGAVIAQVVPTWLIKIIAAAAFFYFAWSSLSGDDDEEESENSKMGKYPILAVFGTFFLAELGDKTQLTAITFAANEGTGAALTVWIACSIGLFAADVVGMLVGYLLKSKLPEGFMNKLALVIFSVFGFLTMAEGVELKWGADPKWIVAGIVAVVFVAICAVTVKMRKKNDQQ